MTEGGREEVAVCADECGLPPSAKKTPPEIVLERRVPVVGEVRALKHHCALLMRLLKLDRNQFAHEEQLVLRVDPVVVLITAFDLALDGDVTSLDVVVEKKVDHSTRQEI